MAETIELVPREYVLWMRVPPRLVGPVAEVVDTLTRTPESRQRWLDATAQRHLHFRIARRDLGELQSSLDADLRAQLESTLPSSSERFRPANVAALGFAGYLPITPLGRELVTSVGVVFSDARAAGRPAAWSAEGSIVARAVHRCTGTSYTLTPVAFDTW